MIYAYVFISAFLGFLVGAWCRGLRAMKEMQRMREDMQVFFRDIGEV